MKSLAVVSTSMLPFGCMVSSPNLCPPAVSGEGRGAGVAVEGTLISTRDAANLAFYGRPHSARTLLSTSDVAPPAAAGALYQALDELLAWAESLPHSPGFLTARCAAAAHGHGATQGHDACASASVFLLRRVRHCFCNALFVLSQGCVASESAT